MRQLEHIQQVALFRWASYQAKTRPELGLLFAIPNGGHRHKAVAGKLKAEGVKAGVPDVCLPVPRTWHDLRHTWASWHIMAGTPLEVLQKLGGWSDIRMVLRYAHLAPEHLAGFANNYAVKQEYANAA